MTNTHADMTIRDCFAIAALPLAIKHWKKLDADIAGGGEFRWCSEEPSDDCIAAAELAYSMADAMLIIRNEGV